ncbi:RNase H family protein [Nocardioides sp. GXQ0305]|uniref:RNase H family protein n=1 Tax=Nocardioides sp. GXQ0305 TaxID=3423912 RepID=UPI003D7C37BF
MTLVAAADGSALGNPGPAGWAWYVDDDCWASGGWPHGTNNMGELTAVLDLLQQSADLDDDLLVYCDSTYTIDLITKWMAGWKRRGWQKADKKPIKNLEIVQALDAAMEGRRDRVHFEWVKGHSGHELNEAADRLANAAALAFQNGEQPPHGPGIDGRRGTHDYQVTRPPEPDADLFSLGDDEPSDEDQVVALERSLLTDEVRSDPAAVAALLDPGWTEVGRSGRVWTREDLLASIGPLPDPVDLEVLGVERVADGVLLLRWRAVAGSGPTTLRSSLWVRSPGGWRQRYHQGTPES